MSSEFDNKDNINNQDILNDETHNAVDTESTPIESDEDKAIADAQDFANDKVALEDTKAEVTTTDADKFDDLDVVDISSDVEYALNQERTGIEVIKLDKNKTARNVNGFDLFFIKLWAVIVSVITFFSASICKGFKKVFKKDLPEKYVTAFLAIVLIIITIVIVLAPFNLTIGDKNKVDIYSNSLLPVAKTIHNEKTGEKYVRWNYINKNGRTICDDYIFIEANPFYNGSAFVKVYDETIKANVWRVIGTNGKFKGKFFVDENLERERAGLPTVGDFNNKQKKAWVYDSQANAYVFVKSNGNRAFDNLEFKYAESFSDGYALVKVGATAYFIDNSGKKAKKSDTYDNALSFSEGIAAVKTDDRWTFVDTKFKPIIEKKTFNAVSSFENGYAWVKSGKSLNVINAKGELMFEGRDENFVDINPSVKPSEKQLRELEETMSE